MLAPANGASASHTKPLTPPASYGSGYRRSLHVSRRFPPARLGHSYASPLPHPLLIVFRSSDASLAMREPPAQLHRRDRGTGVQNAGDLRALAGNPRRSASQPLSALNGSVSRWVAVGARDPSDATRGRDLAVRAHSDP